LHFFTALYAGGYVFIGFVGVWKPRLHPHNPRNLPTLTSRSATFLFIRRSAIFQGSPPPRGHFRKVRQERIGKVPRKTDFFFMHVFRHIHLLKIFHRKPPSGLADLQQNTLQMEITQK
jgi:hypothetical protein